MTTGARPIASSRAGIKPVSQAKIITPATTSAAATTTSRSRMRGLGEAGFGEAGSVMVGLDRNADRCHEHPAGEDATGAGKQPLLRSVEGHSQVGMDIWL